MTETIDIPTGGAAVVLRPGEDPVVSLSVSGDAPIKLTNEQLLAVALYYALGNKEWCASMQRRAADKLRPWGHVHNHNIEGSSYE